jgi:hypothetical protein
MSAGPIARSENRRAKVIKEIARLAIPNSAGLISLASQTMVRKVIVYSHIVPTLTHVVLRMAKLFLLVFIVGIADASI